MITFHANRIMLINHIKFHTDISISYAFIADRERIFTLSW